MQDFIRRYFPSDDHHVSGLHHEIQLHLPQRGRILDLGCGINRDLAAYRTPTREVWGTDFQTHSELEHPEWFRPLDASGRIPFPDECFDLVTAVMVLEHVEKPVTFLTEVARVLRPGGVFIGHTISGNHYVTWIRRLIGLLPHSVNQRLVHRLYGRACEDTFPTFYRLNTDRAFRRGADQSGFLVERLRRYEDPGYFRFSSWLMRQAVRTDWLLERFRPGWGRLYLTATLRKSPEQVDQFGRWNSSAA